MIRRSAYLFIVVLAWTGLASCNSNTSQGGETMTPSPSSNSSAYPQYGHAQDYSWIAGQVSVTRIQGGCTYIVTTPTPTPGPTQQVPGPGTVVVGTAVHSDTSPPLRDITPEVSTPTAPASPGDRFVPGGAWDPSQFKNGDFVVAFGHVAGPGDPTEICPGGTAYVIARVQLNP